MQRLGAAGLAIASALCWAALPAQAADATVGSLTIEHPWSRPTDALATTGAAYFVVKNAAGTPDRLVSASTEVADMAMVHQTVNDGGMMRMQHVMGIDIPAQGSAILKPGSFHIMMTGLKAPFKEGTTYPLRLTFEKAGDVTVQVVVERPAAPGRKAKRANPKPGSHGDMKDEGMQDMPGMKG